MMQKPSKTLPTKALGEIWRAYPHTFARIASRGRWRALPHLRFLSATLTDGILNGNGRFLVSMPPGHGKSEFISHWLPTWFIDRDPRNRVILTTHKQDLSMRWGRAVRNEFRENDWAMTRLAADSEAAGQWNTPEGGGMKVAGTLGGLSGWHANLLIVDDPVPGWDEAFSPLFRQRCVDWFNSVLYQRKLAGATIIVLMTRWHDQDLVGYLRKHHHDDWTYIRLPGLAEQNDPLGREEGEALCPYLHTRESLLASRSSQAVFDALIQQDPHGMGESRLYHHFTDRNVDETLALRDGLPLHLSMDFNVRPGMHAEIGQHLEHEDMITCVYELHAPGMDVRRCMQAFEAWWEEQNQAGRRFPEVQVFGDVSGNARTMTTSESCYDLVEAKLRRMGVPYRLRVPSSAPGVRNSVDDLNEALRDIDDRLHYVVHPRCHRLIVDFREVGPDQHGHPDKSDITLTHASDAERYRVNRIRPINKAMPDHDAEQWVIAG